MGVQIHNEWTFNENISIINRSGSRKLKKGQRCVYDAHTVQSEKKYEHCSHFQCLISEVYFKVLEKTIESCVRKLGLNVSQVHNFNSCCSFVKQKIKSEFLGSFSFYHWIITYYQNDIFSGYTKCSNNMFSKYFEKKEKERKYEHT